MGRVPLGASPSHTALMSSLSFSLTGLWHLVARFLTSLAPTPPPAEHEAWVDEHLLPGERALWVQLDNQDRRHSALVAQRFVAVRPAASREEIAGAILEKMIHVVKDLIGNWDLCQRDMITSIFTLILDTI